MAAKIYSDNGESLLAYTLQLKIVDQLAYIIWATNKRATGRPDQLAGKIGIKKTRLSALINMIRETGIEIEYDRTTESYLFTQGKEYYLQCEIEEKRMD